MEGDQAREVQEEPENDETEANPESAAARPDGRTGQFPNSGFAPGFDQMQMMMAMQNGFGNFPMMGEWPETPPDLDFPTDTPQACPA